MTMAGMPFARINHFDFSSSKKLFVNLLCIQHLLAETSLSSPAWPAGRTIKGVF